MTPSQIIEPARPDELKEALRLLFGHLSEIERDSRVANAVALIEQGELDRQGIMVVRASSGPCAAIAATLMPGATGLVWTPRALAGQAREALEDQLVRHALRWLRQRGAKMAQAIVPPAEAPLAVPLLRNGFAHMATLWYLRYGLPPSPVEEESFAFLAECAGMLTFASFSEAGLASFRSTLERTYEATLDCPELNGVRDLGEIIQGHRGQAHADVRLWWLMLRDKQPVGVLMLTPVPEWNALDLSYLGVVPEFRGRGLGRVLTARALHEARRESVAQVTLAVDSRNVPAWNMYVDMGFEAQEAREVYLAILP